MIARNLCRTLLRAAAVPRATSAASAVAVARASIRPCVVPGMRTFSVTRSVLGQGEYDAELAGKLAQELSYEQENSNLFIGDSPTSEPGFVSEFKQAGIWKLRDTPGQDEVALEREFGNEHIQILFSVGDIDTSGALPEDNEDGTPGEIVGPPEQPDQPQYPIRISATITKPAGGAIVMDGFVQDGDLNIDNIAYYKDKEMATRIDADADFQRRGFYLGPQFDTLDEAVQNQWYQFWAERGFDANMALFIPNYAEYKEQREYCDWLANMRDFINA
ncbi:mitochondrial p32 family protein [Mycosarcoma maydis]|uniref:Mitochondrial Mrb1 n=1 Tax=Mycosarcoma maydis TaxID=5270 RepID=Q697D5_MYCMD|nr:mitochondrial p32 family protein [Ustilago maydis 521]AAT81148.1 mitochondrial Mrb1 [Ustilago maydis]KIS65802.1 mitochondrial p32 family protein [Ustilago maydis 521]|eukprot:XP_011392552.1 mitochondrial p32 family protein [Ustilago maydis 521]